MSGGDGDHEDKPEDKHRVVGVPVPPLAGGRFGYLVVWQVVEQPGQVRPGLGSHCLIDALVELGLVEAAVTVMLAEAVGDLRAFGIGDSQVGLTVADPAAKCGCTRPWRTGLLRWHVDATLLGHRNPGSPVSVTVSGRTG